MSLHTNGAEIVPYPPSLQESVSEAADAWREFIAQPQASKDTLAAADAQFSEGYERKFSGEHGSRDYKENFDATPRSLKSLRERSTLPANQKLCELSARVLSQLALPAQLFTKQVEDEYGIERFAQYALQSQPEAYLRFLHYPPAPEGTVLGEAHTDHSGYTFHLYESTGGCRGLAPNTRQWYDMKVEEGSMLAFGGMQLQLISKGEVRALCHEIIANQETARNGRIAIVCFNALLGVPYFDRATHGRLQDFKPGFNYDMPHDKFGNLFNDK